jgi:hypothetical protein
MCGKWWFVGDWELFAWITFLTVVFKSTKLDPNELESRIAPNVLLEKLPKPPPPPPLPEESPYSRRAYPVEEPPIR